jgi:hypothetical protein
MAITLRPSDEQLEQIEKVKSISGEKSASKALFRAAAAYPKLKDDLSRANSKIDNLEYQLRELKYSIQNFGEAQERMLKLASE